MQIILKPLKVVKFFSSVVYLFFVLTIIGPLGALLIGQPQRAHEFWSKLATKSLAIQFYKISESKALQKNKRTIYLVNHRTQGDFFIHDIVTEFTGNYLARWMVAIIFPITFLMSTIFTRSVWFFKRGGNDLNKYICTDTFQRFYIWCDQRFSTALRSNLVVYPEGHRMSKKEQAGPLKKGMIKYAYERKIDVQIVMCFGIEDVFNEKELHVNWGPNQLTTYIDDVVHPEDYKNLEQFFEVIEKRFIQSFDLAYTYYSEGNGKLNNDCIASEQ